MLRNALHLLLIIISFKHKGLERFYRKGTWAISVSGNWRLTFQFENGNVYILNYEDYH